MKFIVNTDLEFLLRTTALTLTVCKACKSHVKSVKRFNHLLHQKFSLDYQVHLCTTNNRKALKEKINSYIPHLLN